MKANSDIEKLLGSYHVPDSGNKEKAWVQIESKLEDNRTARVILLSKRTMAVAAIFFAVVIVFTGLVDSGVIFRSKILAGTTQVTSDLDDGSQVVVNPNSVLYFRYSRLTGIRRFWLQGESKFKIEKGKKCIIDFGSGEVEVLGTEFIVTAYRQENVEVSCLSGRVRVNSRKDESILNSGQQVSINDKSMTEPKLIEKNNLLKQFAGDYAWKDTPLEAVFEKLGNRFGYRIQAGSSVLLRQFTGDIHSADVASAMEILSVAMDFTYTIDPSTKTIKVEP